MGVFGNGFIMKRLDPIMEATIQLQNELDNFNKLFEAIEVMNENAIVIVNEEEAKKSLWQKIKDLWHRFTEWVKSIWNKIFHKKSTKDAEEAVKEVDAAVQANEQNTEVTVEKTDKTTGKSFKEKLSPKKKESEEGISVKEIITGVGQGYREFQSIFPDKTAFGYLYSANLLLSTRNVGNSDTINTNIEDFEEAANAKATKVDKVEEAFKNVTINEVTIKATTKEIGKYNNKLKSEIGFYKDYKAKFEEACRNIDQYNEEMQQIIDKGEDGVKAFVYSTLSNSDAKAKEEYYKVMGNKIPGMISKDIARAKKVIDVLTRGAATCDTVLENIARTGDKLTLAIADVKK